MKREVFFKGKLNHSNRWIEGNLITARNGNKYIIPFEIFEPDGHHLIIDSDEAFRVNNETVCQYAGFTDKNGKKVFEGDYNEDGFCLVFCDECHGLQFAQLDQPTKDICMPCHACDGNFLLGDVINDFEVIGNIHD